MWRGKTESPQAEGAAAGAGAPDTQDGAQTSGGAAGGLTDSGEAAFGALTRVPFFDVSKIYLKQVQISRFWRFVLFVESVSY